MIINVTDNLTWDMQKDRHIAILTSVTDEIQALLLSIIKQLEINSVLVVESSIEIKEINFMEAFNKIVIIKEDFPNITIMDLIDLFSLASRHSNIHILATFNQKDNFDPSGFFKVMKV